MIIGTILQIIGIIFVTSGSILALTKLFQGHFERLALDTELRKWYYEQYKKYSDENIEREIKSLEEAMKSKTFAPEYKEMRMNFFQIDMKRWNKERDEMEKKIMKRINAEKCFIIFGVGLIIAGSILQVIGIIIDNSF
jgi:hypothetical protein